MDRLIATIGGRRFIDGTVPELVEELVRLSRNLEALVAALAANGQACRPVAREGCLAV